MPSLRCLLDRRICSGDTTQCWPYARISRSEHLWQIPNLIQSIAPEYHLFLRRYAEECWEGVCYAIPSQRLKCA